MPKYSRNNRKSRKVTRRSRSYSKKGGAVHSALQQGGKRRHRRAKSIKKGGMLEGVVVAAKTALLPYLMYKAQKNMQSNVKTSKNSRRSRRR